MASKINHNVKTKSGAIGWQGKLKDVYTDLKEFESYCSVYGNHKRLGYKTPENAWNKNPTIQGSTNPSDYRKIRATK